MILVDLDGVLMDFIGPLCDLLNRPDVMKARWPGLVRKVSQFQAYPLEDTLSRVELGLVDGWMKDGTLVQQRRWYVGARLFLKALQKQAPTVVLTAGGPGNWNEYTTKVVAAGNNTATVHFASPEAKAEVPGLTLIEDRPDTATNWSERHGRFAILLDRPWNVGADIGPRVLRAKDYSHAKALVEVMSR